jgi:HlyD family secretion protein
VSQHSRLSLFAAILTLLLMPVLAAAQDAGAKDNGKESDKDEPKTQTVKPGPFKVEVTFDGVYEAAKATEMILEPEVWSSLKVEEVIDEGQRVRKGDTLLKLETDDLDDAIRDQEFALRLSGLALQQAKVELATLEKSVPLDLEAARRAQRIAEEELEYFRNIREEQQKTAAAESLKSAEYSLEYSQEELDQLEQMYKADDLTEQTEEIILKRAQRSVERSQYFLDIARNSYTRTMDFTIPRERQQVEEADVRARLSLRKSEATLPASLDKARTELEKTAVAHQRLEEKLQQHKADRELMVVKAPVEGIVYYGQAERGVWTTAATLRKQLRPAGSVSANTVLMTIVADEPTVVRVDVPEKDYRHFSEGVPAVVKPTAFPDTTYKGTCGPLSPAAVKPGTFDGEVRFEIDDGEPKPLAGMTCKVTITPYQSDSAIAVPESAVFGEAGERHVYIEDGGEAKKQAVTTGESSGGKIEIKDGLNEGDVLLLEKP